MIKRSLRMGVRLGLLAGIVFAVLKVMQSRRPAPPGAGDLDTWTSAVPPAPVARDPDLVEPTMLTTLGQGRADDDPASALSSPPVPEAARAPSIVSVTPPPSPPAAEPVPTEPVPTEPVEEVATAEVAAPVSPVAEPVKKASRKKATPAKKAAAATPAGAEAPTTKKRAAKKAAPARKPTTVSKATPPPAKKAAKAKKTPAPRKRTPPPVP